jgi:hypothetical protein
MYTYEENLKLNNMRMPYAPARAWRVSMEEEALRQQKDEAARAAAAQGGVSGMYGGAASSAAPAPGAGAFDQGGVMPVGVLEPFNDWQKQAFEQMSTAYNSPWASKAMGAYDQALAYSGVPQQTAGMAVPAIQRGMREISDADVNTGIARYMNPYQQQVIDRTTARLNEQGDIVRNRLAGRRAGSSSFGDSSSAIQLAENDKNVLGQVADTTANLNYTGYNNAMGFARDDFNQARTRDFQGAGLFNQTAGTQLSNLNSLSQLANLGMAGNQMDVGNRQQNIKNILTAGTAVQDQNQKMLNAVQGEYGRMQGYDKQQLNDLASYLNAFTSSTSRGATPDSSNTLGKAGALGMLGVDFYKNNFAGDSGSSAWLNPDTGRFV